MGKSNSKLKSKHRTRSMAWNSRFPSVASLSGRRKQPQTRTCDLTVSRWLNLIDLNEYADVFEKFSTIDDVMSYTDGDLHDLGVKKDVDRSRMISSLVAMRAIRCERLVDASGSTDDGVSTANVDNSPRRRQRHSMAVEPSALTSTSRFESTDSMAEILRQSTSSIDVKMEATAGPDHDSEWTRSKNMLEWELSLDARDLRSHAWYHGRVSRAKAEQIVADRDGDFLVRDCSSQPGNYVLTCRSKGQTLHFVINKIILQPDTVYESVQYRFEEDGFDTVPDLITYYVGSGKPVTTVSDAKIRTPRNRQHPLSWCSGGGDQTADAIRPTGHWPASPASSPPTRAPPTERSPPTAAAASLRRDSSRNRRPSRGNSSAGPVAASLGSSSSSSPPPPEYANRAAHPPTERSEDANRDDVSHANDDLDGGQPEPEERSPPPPPKPSRSVRQPAADAEARSRDTLRRRSSSGVVIKHAKYSAADRADGGPSLAFASSMPRLPSAFDLDNSHTLLLPVAENKPLDVEALRAVHALLVESGSRTLANHLTRADLRLTVANLGAEYVGCMCATGIELATLPHGRRHRSDLIERTECLKLLVATTILTCDTESERAELLNKWIEVAIDAKTALGNLFGFCAIMLGLCTPQVQRLDETWHILRQKFTDSAFNFEAKLRPTLKSMNESTNPSAPNTTIPHLLPVLLLYERAFDEVTEGARPFRANSLHATIDQWETSTADLGLSTWYAHLDGSRQFCRLLPTFRRNAEIVLADSKVDELLLDMFRTEFHLKFLWGSRGAMVAAAERHLKFEQILGVMSEKCESAAISEGYA